MIELNQNNELELTLFGTGDLINESLKSLKDEIDEKWNPQYDLENIGKTKFHTFFKTKFRNTEIEVWEDDCSKVYFNNFLIYTWSEDDFEFGEFTIQKIKKIATEKILQSFKLAVK